MAQQKRIQLASMRMQFNPWPHSVGGDPHCRELWCSEGRENTDILKNKQRGNGHVVASHYSGAQKPQDTRGEALKHRLEGGCPPQGPRAIVPTAPSVIRATLHPALLPALKDPPHASELPGGKPAPHLPAPASRAGRSSGKSTAGNRKRGSHRLPGAVSAHTGLGRREREDEGDGSPRQALAQGTPSL